MVGVIHFDRVSYVIFFVMINGSLNRKKGRYKKKVKIHDKDFQKEALTSIGQNSKGLTLIIKKAWVRTNIFG